MPGQAFSATRGRDWGLKDATAGATAYTRPINVRCLHDQLVLVPERGTEQEPVVIPMSGSTRGAVDPFVQALWKRMGRWGLAGNHAYWKPILKVEVGPDAEIALRGAAVAPRGKRADPRTEDAMSRPRSDEFDSAPGMDSFLDVVCNLVGIFIVLVMVIGIRAKDATIESELKAEPAAAAVPAPDVEAARLAARDAEAHIHEVNQQIRQVNAEVEQRRVRAESPPSRRPGGPAKDRRAQGRLGRWRSASNWRLAAQLAAARQTLQGIEQHRQAPETAGPTVGVIEHLPTPMAKTVLGREEHFRLADGRLAYIPWETLVDKLKAEAPQKVWKLKEAPSTSETIGPEGGFLMRYTLVRKQFATPTKLGTAIRQGVELEKFVIVPVSDDLGEPLAQAMQLGSQFQARLAQFDPQRTTLTVWVYPNSFNDFRTLKQELFQRGFLTAARPLPEDMPIGGSPQGSRSAAQ